MGFIRSKYPELVEADDLLSTDPQRSLQICDRILMSDPDCYDALLHKVFAYQRLEDWSKALDMANELIRVKPAKALGYELASGMHYCLGNYPEAIAYAHMTLASDKTKWYGKLPYRLLAVSYARLGDQKTALSYANRGRFSGQFPFIVYGPFIFGTFDQFKEYVQALSVKAQEEGTVNLQPVISYHPYETIDQFKKYLRKLRAQKPDSEEPAGPVVDVSDEELDALLMERVGTTQHKVARIIAEAMRGFDSWDEDRLTQRMVSLVESGRVESFGDVTQWGYSEVRLPLK
jgi:hypothetical protein